MILSPSSCTGLKFSNSLFDRIWIKSFKVYYYSLIKYISLQFRIAKQDFHFTIKWLEEDKEGNETVLKIVNRVTIIIRRLEFAGEIWIELEVVLDAWAFLSSFERAWRGG